MNYDTYLKSGRLTRGVNHAPCWPDASCCCSCPSAPRPAFFLFAQLLLLILFYCFNIVVIDFVVGGTHFFLFTLTLSVTIKLFVINELNFSSTRLLFIALDTFSTSC